MTTNMNLHVKLSFLGLVIGLLFGTICLEGKNVIPVSSDSYKVQGLEKYGAKGLLASDLQSL